MQQARRKFVISGCFLAGAILFCALYYYSIFPFKKPYARVPITFLIHSPIPCVDVEIEGVKSLFGIDLRSSSSLRIRNELLDKWSKKASGKMIWRDIYGKKNYAQTYLIDHIKMAKVKIVKTIARKEEIKEAIHRSTFWKRSSEQEKEIVTNLSGLIGGKILSTYGLLLDFNHSHFFLVRNPTALKKEGYILEKFTEVPFEVNENGIILSFDTNIGIKKFVLDSISYYSLLKKSVLQDSESPANLSLEFNLGGGNHDNVEFRPLEGPVFEDVDGLLGMSFLVKHMIYLDFKGKKAKILPSSTIDTWLKYN